MVLFVVGLFGGAYRPSVPGPGLRPPPGYMVDTKTKPKTKPKTKNVAWRRPQAESGTEGHHSINKLTPRTPKFLLA